MRKGSKSSRKWKVLGLAISLILMVFIFQNCTDVSLQKIVKQAAQPSNGGNPNFDPKCAPATTRWATVDDFQFETAQTGIQTMATGLHFLPPSQILVTGRGVVSQASPEHKLFRIATTDALQFSTTADLGNLDGSQFVGRLAHSGSQIFLGDPNSSKIFISIDGAHTFTEDTAYTTLTTGKANTGASVFIDSTQKLRVAGSWYQSSGTGQGLHSAVRTKDLSTNTWSTTLDTSLVTGDSTQILFLNEDPSRSLFVYGTTQTAGGTPVSSGWAIAKAFGSGSLPPQTVYQMAPGKFASPIGMVVAPDNSWYVAGTAIDANDNIHWIVRKSSDGGATWSVSDDFNLARDSTSIKTSKPNKITVGPDGSLYVVGTAKDLGAGSHLVVRRSLNQGKYWCTVDVIDVPNKPDESFANDVLVTPQGDIFVVGYITMDGYTRWLVRKWVTP